MAMESGGRRLTSVHASVHLRSAARVAAERRTALMALDAYCSWPRISPPLFSALCTLM